MSVALKSMSENASRLLSAHLDLFRAELRTDAKKLARDGVLTLSAVPFLMVGFALLNVALAFAIGSAIGLGWGFFVVGLIDAIVGGTVGLVFSKKAKNEVPHFERTTEELRRDKEWLAQIRNPAPSEPAIVRARV